MQDIMLLLALLYLDKAERQAGAIQVLNWPLPEKKVEGTVFVWLHCENCIV